MRKFFLFKMSSTKKKIRKIINNTVEELYYILDHCEEDTIINPDTGRYVQRTGKIGQMITNREFKSNDFFDKKEEQRRKNIEQRQEQRKIKAEQKKIARQQKKEHEERRRQAIEQEKINREKRRNKLT